MSEVTLTCACERVLRQTFGRNEQGYRTAKWECDCGDPRPYSKESDNYSSSRNSLTDIYKFFLPDDVDWEGMDLQSFGTEKSGTSSESEYNFVSKEDMDWKGLDE